VELLPFSALSLLVWRQEEHPACKKFDVVLPWLSVCGSEDQSAYGPADTTATQKWRNVLRSGTPHSVSRRHCLGKRPTGAGRNANRRHEANQLSM